MGECVFLIINSFNGGGAEHAASRLTGLLGRKYKVVVLSLMPRTEDDYDFGSSAISIHDAYKGKIWFSRIKRAAVRIDELAGRYRPKAMIAFLQNAGLCLMMTQYKTRKIISVRNYLEEQYRGYKQIMWKLLIRRYFKRADRIVSVSRQIHEEMINVYHMPPEKCVCINNLYDLEKIAEDGREKLEDEYKEFYDAHIVISSVGRVSPQKGHFHLVRILKQLNGEDTGEKRFGLVIIGYDGDPYAEKIRRLVDAYHLQRDVLFTGQKKNPYKYVSNSMCYVCPSKYEGFPNALVEAMICKVPVIASDCRSGPREILGQGEGAYGFLVDFERGTFPDSKKPLTKMEKQIAAVIKMLSWDEGLRSMYAGRAFCRACDFSAEKIIGAWYGLLDG